MPHKSLRHYSEYQSYLDLKNGIKVLGCFLACLQLQIFCSYKPMCLQILT